ncbi:MAG TPA: hypothetical protein VEI01_04290 [Terriglobales bacterium]|nr:hypothetical protein [Terriglobales bacterium]
MSAQSSRAIRKIRYVKGMDLFQLQVSTDHPHGLSDLQFDALIRF